MYSYEIVLPDIIDTDEFKKIIGFVSEEIISFELKKSVLKINLKRKDDNKEIQKTITELASNFISSANMGSTIFLNEEKKKIYQHLNFAGVNKLDEGMICLDDKALFLYKYFDEVFKKIAFSADDNCIEKLYPVMLPTTQYKKTGYLRNSPQYALFCCCVCEDIKKLQNLEANVDGNQIKKYLKYPKYALSPSACFHSYIEYQNKTLEKCQLLTFTQSVFRNEGRFNYSEFGRLKDYHVREIVLFGNMDYVVRKRMEIMNKAIQILKNFNLNGDVEVSADAFIVPKMQKYKKIQFFDKSKYEMHLKYQDKSKIAVASFNLHGTAFTDPFKIKINGCEEAVTGCVGFGLERWVLAFLSQYGTNVSEWPTQIKEEFYNE